MSEFTIVQISDLHLSRTHPFFNVNWRSLMPRLESAAPAVVVVSGDLTIDGAGAPDDLAWAANELRQIRMSPWLALPGNHDVGEEFVDAAHGQVINTLRRSHWLEQLGAIGGFGRTATGADRHRFTAAWQRARG
jgi:3',5'-cyclic AMP phosphodiesterase CpdA